MKIKSSILTILGVMALVVGISACGQFDENEEGFQFGPEVYPTTDGKLSITVQSFGEDSQYVVIPVSHTEQASQNVYSMSSGSNEEGNGGSAGGDSFTRAYIPLRMQIEHRFREMERKLIESGEVWNLVRHDEQVAPKEDGASCTSDVTCGADEFCDGGVCRSELTLNFTDPETMEYEEVVAKVKRVSSTSIIVVDAEVADSIDANDIESIGRAFDSIVYPRDIAFFGQNLKKEDLDIDGNGRIIIFMTPKLNRVEGFAGLFNARDLIARSQSNPASNERDMFYVVVPDEDNPLDLIYATLAHEFQHMLNFDIRAISRAKAGKSPVYETVWLNEGLSHLAEDIVGYGKDAPAFVKKYIESPAEYTLQYSDSNADADTPGNRGLAYMFLRYLFEQKGGVYYDDDPSIVGDKGGASFLNKLYDTDKKGIENLSYAIGDDYKKFFHNWLITVAIAGKLTTDNVLYNYEEPSKDPVTGFMHGVSLFGSAETSAGTIELNGVAFETFAGSLDAYTTGTGGDFVLMDVPSDVDLVFESDVLANFYLIVARIK